MKLQKNQKGIAHHLLLAGVAVLVLGAVGFAGMKVYKSKSDVNAKAAGWGTVVLSGANGGLKIYACKYNSTGVKFTYLNAYTPNITFTINGAATTFAGPNNTRTVYKTITSSTFYATIVSWSSGTGYMSNIVAC